MNDTNGASVVDVVEISDVARVAAAGASPVTHIRPEQPRRSYQLICEGDCNGGRPSKLDRTVLDERKRYGQGELRPIVVRALRLLVHTTHVHVRGDVFKCDVCGSERKFGATI